jgi:hypothetical protein
MQERLTNEEFVSKLMSFSAYGALTQAFVIEAIRYYSEKVSSTPEPQDDKEAVINPVIWHKIAVDINKALEEQYGNKNNS